MTTYKPSSSSVRAQVPPPSTNCRDPQKHHSLITHAGCMTGTATARALPSSPCVCVCVHVYLMEDMLGTSSAHFTSAADPSPEKKKNVEHGRDRRGRAVDELR